MILYCPKCCKRHIDRGDFATKPHKEHACQGCGHVWKPARVATVGVEFLPGYKDPDAGGYTGDALLRLEEIALQAESDAYEQIDNCGESLATSGLIRAAEGIRAVIRGFNS